LHQQLIDRQNARKQNAIHDLAHARATSLIAKARANADKERLGFILWGKVFYGTGPKTIF
jgi:hypothetical protein